MISYAAYCSTQAMHNCAHEVAKYLISRDFRPSERTASQITC